MRDRGKKESGKSETGVEESQDGRYLGSGEG